MNITTYNYAKIERPDSVDAIKELVHEGMQIEVCGGQTHGKLAPGSANVILVNLTDYRGITEYEPQEYVISARAGTPISEISAELKQHNQYLPFDPPSAHSETTLGGVVATGWSGPGSLRFGRLRDFILGVDMLPGTGNWIRGGGKVVKNSAGFDLPKLMVGSLGCFGIIGNITLKVFPSPVAFNSIRGNFHDFGSGFECLGRVLDSGIILDGCVLEPSGCLSVRLGGPAGSLPQRTDKVRRIMGIESELLESANDEQLWQDLRNTGPGFGSAGRCKIPIRPSEIMDWQAFLTGKPYRYFYDQAGSVLVIDLDEGTEIRGLAGHLISNNRSALCVGLPGGPKWMGPLPDMTFLNRIRKALDPQGKFPDIKHRTLA